MKKKSDFKTINTSLKSILKNYNEIQPEINELVLKCNRLIIQTYQFIRLYVIYKYKNRNELPIIDTKFISYCLKVQGIKEKSRGKPIKDSYLLDELNKFYIK